MSTSRDVALNFDSAFHDLQSTSEFICNVYAYVESYLSAIHKVISLRQAVFVKVLFKKQYFI